MQFRAEVFDILNHPNFNLPNQNVFTSTCALNAPTCPAVAFTPSPVAGQITSTIGNEVVGGAQRVIQFGLKLLF